MKKALLWMFAAILTCGTSMLTACSDDDSSNDTPAIENLAQKIQGKWMMAEVNGRPNILSISDNRKHIRFIY